MKLKYLLGVALSSVVLATSSFAATLSITGGTDVTLPSDFDLSGAASLTGYSLSIDSAGPNTGGTHVTRFLAGSGGGLNLVGGSSGLTFTYLGSEAGATNTAFTVSGGSVLSNKAVGAQASVTSVGGVGLVEFTFSTIFDPNANPILEGSISNGGATSGHQGSGLSMAFLKVSDTSVLAFFGDGRGDDDLDDMVVLISAVPLPAGGLLLLSAFGGLAAFRRRKMKLA